MTDALTSKQMSPQLAGLVNRLQEWSRNCLIDGLKMDAGEPTLQELLREAYLTLMRSGGPPVPETPAPLTGPQRNANYKSHEARSSDSSIFDEVCTVCGAKDYAIGPDELSDRPCTAVKTSEPPHDPQANSATNIALYGCKIHGNHQCRTC